MTTDADERPVESYAETVTWWGSRALWLVFGALLAFGAFAVSGGMSRLPVW